MSTNFEPLFDRWASRVRRRLALRHVLTGAALGAVLALVPAGLAWKMRHGKLRPYAALTILGGVAGGAIVARRKRWSDEEVALYLDGELASEEAISTAVDLDATGPDSETDPAMRAVVLQSAATALHDGDRKRAKPTMFRLEHLLIPAALAGVGFISRAPLPPAPIVATEPGTTKIQLAEVDGLEKVIKLAQLDPRDEAQRQRLDKIAKDAEKLKEDLNKGLEKRDAQDRIAKLKEQIAAERLTLGDGEQRAGLESAVSKLEENDEMKRAAKALGDHDLETMDQEMEKIANAREKQDRELAKKSLDDAASAARKNGAPDVAKALEAEKKAMEQREKRAQALRDLADAMKQEGIKNDSVETQSEALDRKGTDDAAKKLADAMGKAMEKLTPEEKKRLADRMKQNAQKGGGAANSDPQQLKDMAEQLSTPEGQKKLEEQLKEQAKEDDETKESKRQKGLDDAQNGADGTEKDIGKQKGQQGEQGENGEGQNGQQQGQQNGQQGQQGQQGQNGQGQQQGQQGQNGQGQQGQQGQNGQGQQGQNGQGQQGQNGMGMGQGLGVGQGQQQGQPNGNGSGGDAQNGQNGGGGSHDVGTGDHKGSTGQLNADTLKSRAHGTINKGQGMPGSITTTAQGRAGGTANVRGTGDLKVVGPSEVDGVERSDVPQEYRDQVRQYFQP